MLKMLLFGKTGQLGRELLRSLASLGEVVAPDHDDRALCGDLCNSKGVADTVLAVRPDIVVNAAALTDVDWAERNRDMAVAVNAHAPGAMARAASDIGAWLVHYSSEYVFDGSGSRAWTETDMPAPLNVYGESKLLGDLLVTQQCPGHLIFRTSWLYAAGGNNFPQKIIRKAFEGRQVQVVDDQFGAPTSAKWLADVTASSLHKVMSGLGLAGVYHAAPVGEISRYRYACFVLEQAQKLGLLPKTALSLVAAVNSANQPVAARRPLNSRLDTTRLRKNFGLDLPDWQDGVTKMLKDLP